MSWNYPTHPDYPGYGNPEYPGHGHPGHGHPGHPGHLGPGHPVVCPPGPPQHHDTGFQDGRECKIESAADGMALDVAGANNKKGAKVITYTSGDQENQKFTAHKLGVGFRLVLAFQGKKGEELVLDYNRQAGTLTTWESSNGTNQLFMAQEISPGSKLFTIKCIENNHCLRHNGHGNQVTVVPETPGDVLQQWRIVPAY